MSIPGMPNPTEAVAEVEKSLKELAEQTGLSKVDGVVAKFKETAEAAKKGPSEIIDKLKGAMTEFTGKLTAAIDHPEDLVAGSGALALIAAWYGRSVAGKLQELAQEAGEIATTVSQQGSKVAEPFQNIPKLLGDVQETLGAKVAGLTKLLADLQLLGSTVKGPADLAKVETKAMKEALDMGSLGDLLKKLGELKASLGPLISSISGVIDKIEDFLSTVSDKLTRSFDVPHPLCFLTGCAMQQAPASTTSSPEYGYKTTSRPKSRYSKPSHSKTSYSKSRDDSHPSRYSKAKSIATLPHSSAADYFNGATRSLQDSYPATHPERYASEAFLFATSPPNYETYSATEATEPHYHSRYTTPRFNYAIKPQFIFATKSSNYFTRPYSFRLSAPSMGRY